MAVIDMQNDVLVMGSAEKLLLREERKRTGRYMAAGAAIFLSLLGLYQAVVRGTPEYAALFAPALIMFVYILWILYASKNQMKAAAKELERAKAEESSNCKTDLGPSQEDNTVAEKDNTKKANANLFSRSYSVA